MMGVGRTGQPGSTLATLLKKGPKGPFWVTATRAAWQQTTSQPSLAYSTVTDLARFRGWSTSVPLRTATW